MEIPDDNFINIKPEEYNSPIYRVTTIDRLLDMLKSKNLILRRPKLWEDPFENILINTTVKEKNLGNVKFDGVMKCFYGQCWTLEKESDAMWRIYVPCKHSVKIKTTIHKLLSAIYDKIEINPDRRCFIGKVIYDNDITSVLHQIASLDFVTDPTFISQAMTLIIKPNAYSYEKEIRLIYRSERNLPENEQNILVEPISLIEEIIFNPRLNRDEFEEYSKIVKNLGYKDSIDRSTLYDPISYIINSDNL